MSFKGAIFLPFRYIKVRSLSNFRRDPGIHRRQKLISVDKFEEPDFVEFESDFMDVHKSHKEYVQELELLKEQTKYHIVKQKYFKNNYPNFLTWHDKEQIRYLHRTDPDEWSIEKLAEGFPALPNVIKQILKSNWIKTKQNKITNHDQAVQKNWELFKAGKMSNLPKELVEHLNKFTNRALNFKPFILPQTGEAVAEMRPKGTPEFADIILNYQKLQKKPLVQEIDEKEAISKPPDKDTYCPPIKTNKKYAITLKTLHENLKKNGKIDEEDNYILTSLSGKAEISEEPKTNLVDLSQNKYDTSSGALVYYQKTERDLSHLIYPEKIAIPKKLHKKGSTYKLNDCYYDDDGGFLYRVPGMG